MCFKQFRGYDCGHCDVPVLWKCPLASQDPAFRPCAITAERNIPSGPLCPACKRIQWNKQVLAQEKEHQLLHSSGQCSVDQCGTALTEEEMARVGLDKSRQQVEYEKMAAVKHAADRKTGTDAPSVSSYHGMVVDYTGDGEEVRPPVDFRPQNVMCRVWSAASSQAQQTHPNFRDNTHGSHFERGGARGQQMVVNRGHWQRGYVNSRQGGFQGGNARGLSYGVARGPILYYQEQPYQAQQNRFGRGNLRFQRARAWRGPPGRTGRHHSTSFHCHGQADVDAQGSGARDGVIASRNWSGTGNFGPSVPAGPFAERHDAQDGAYYIPKTIQAGGESVPLSLSETSQDQGADVQDGGVEMDGGQHEQDHARSCDVVPTEDQEAIVSDEEPLVDGPLVTGERETSSPLPRSVILGPLLPPWSRRSKSS